MKLRIYFVLFLLYVGGVFCYSKESDLIINEFQASNGSTMADEDGVYSDWIELKNTTSNRISLAGWSLTDEAQNPGKWVFPNVSLDAGGYLLVFASGNDRRDPGSPLHLNFKISATGEFLGLYSPDKIPSTLFNPFPLQETNQSFGLFSGAFVEFKTPTPGKANTDTSILRYPAPVFSRQRGLYYQSFLLSITSPLKDAAIYYTLDGTVPSPSNGTFYTHLLEITGTTILRAIAIGSYPNPLGISSSSVKTQTYIFPEDVIHQGNTPAGYPANWGKYAQQTGYSIADYEMDPELMAEPAYAAKVKTALTELPIISLVTDKNNFFNNVANEETGGIYMFTGPPVGYSTGRGWERPVSFEYFFTPDSVSLQVDCGIELHGGHSRLPEKCPKHSFKLDFKNQYGPSKLYYPLFGKSEAPSQNSFNLRAGFGTTWLHQTAAGRTLAVYSRDEWSKKTQKRMGNLSTNTIYAHLFIDGLYWGLYNPTEKIDEDFCESYLGGDKLEYDVIEVDETSGQNTVATSGNVDAWNSLTSQVASASDPVVYQKIQGNNPDGTPNPAYPALIDLDNYIDFMLLNFYDGNTDWDYHNWVALRNRMIPDKGFRFLVWDSEEILKSISDNIVTKNNAGWPTTLFKQLIKNQLFVRRWGDRVQKHCFNNGSLTPKMAAETFTSLTSQIDNSVYAESARWGDYRKDVHQWQSVGELYRKDDQYDAQKKVMLETYFPGRTDAFLKQLRTAGLFPSTEAPAFKINGIQIQQDSISEGDMLSMSAPLGSIYFTKDKTDPVIWTSNGDGTISNTAIKYTSAFSPEIDMTVKARALYQGVWSALNEQNFIRKEIPVGLTQETHLLSQVTACNYPNPFTDQTTFKYTVPFDAQVQLDVYDVSGRLISVLIDQKQTAGSYELPFDGSNLPRGIYLARFKVRGSINHQLVFKISKW